MIYVYRCPLHGEIEKDYPMGLQPPHVVCGVDGCRLQARRVYTSPAVQYRGTGWSWGGGVRHGDPSMDDREREHITKNADKTGYS